MATPHAVEIVLSAEEREHLEKLLRKQTAERRAVGRARIVLLAADGLTNQQIAEATGYARWTVTTWRQRFAKDRLAGLQDKPRSGRPPVFSPGAAASDDRPGL
jgi:CRP-like cAMP-binding protein